jgi:RES domain-containing protein
MLVYRIGKTKFANDITGEGARLNGGRWNNKGTACIYTAESRALAVLEYTVNVNVDDIPRALCITTFEIPDTGIYELKDADLPGNWRDMPAPSSTKDLGTNLLNTAATLIIKVPSTVITEEFNYLINPAHMDSKDIKIIDVKDFVYDVRIKLV